MWNKDSSQVEINKAPVFLFERTSKLSKLYEDFEKYLLTIDRDTKSYFLDTDKVNRWITGLVQKARSNLDTAKIYREFGIHTTNADNAIKQSKSGPAVTLNINGIDVDLVLAFTFKVHDLDGHPRMDFKGSADTQKVYFQL